MINFESKRPGKKFEVDEKGFVSFSDVARVLMNQQSQYASRYIDGKMEGYPNLGEGLRFEGDSYDYHNLRIHGEDVDEFVSRVKEYRKSTVNPFV